MRWNAAERSLKISKMVAHETKTPSQLGLEAGPAVAIDLCCREARKEAAMFDGLCYGMIGAIYFAMAVHHFMES